MTTSGPETTGNKVMTDTTKSEDPKNGVPERLFRLPVATATVIAVILLTSLTADALLALNLTAISRRQNTAWKNTNSAFAKVINWASLGGLGRHAGRPWDPGLRCRPLRAGVQDLGLG